MESPQSTSPNNRWIGLLFISTGIASLVLYRAGLRAGGARDIVWFLKLASAQIVIYLIAVWLILRARPSRVIVITVLAFAIFFRLAILFSPPFLSDDIYRYIWDGRVQAAGINPYRYIPADESLVPLRDENIYPRINRRDYAHTIYPPVAQMTFFLTTRLSESVTWMKVTVLVFEGVAIWVLAQLLGSFNLPRQRLLLYAWNPLIVWEFAGSGHVDALAIAFIMLALLARRRNAETLTGVTLACAVLVKLFPVVLFPALFKRWSWKMTLAFVAVILTAYVPYLGASSLAALGFLPGYLEEQGLASGEQFYLLSLTRLLLPHADNTLFLIFSGLTMSALSAWSVFKAERDERSYIRRAALLATAATVLFAPHYSWYFTWLVPFLCFVPLMSMFYLNAAAFALYLTWLGDKPEQMFRLNSAIYLPFALLLMAGLLIRRIMKNTILEETARPGGIQT